MAALNPLQRRRHAGIKAGHNHAVTVLGLDIHSLFLHTAVVDNEVAAVLYIHITQESDVLRVKLTAHTGDFAADGVDEAGLGNKGVAVFKNANPFGARRNGAGQGFIRAVHVAFRPYGNAYLLAHRVHAGGQGRNRFVADVLAGLVGDIPHIFHLYAVHPRFFKKLGLLNGGFDNFVHRHLAGIVQGRARQRPQMHHGDYRGTVLKDVFQSTHGQSSFLNDYIFG